MKNFMLVLVAVLIALAGANSFAAFAGATSTVSYVAVYGNGKVLVMGPNFQFANANCSNNGGFFIPGNHPRLKEFLALALSARATGSQLQVYASIDNCWYPQITEDESSNVFALSGDVSSSRRLCGGRQQEQRAMEYPA